MLIGYLSIGVVLWMLLIIESYMQDVTISHKILALALCVTSWPIVVVMVIWEIVNGG